MIALKLPLDSQFWSDNLHVWLRDALAWMLDPNNAVSVKQKIVNTISIRLLQITITYVGLGYIDPSKSIFNKKNVALTIRVVLNTNQVIEKAGLTFTCYK